MELRKIFGFFYTLFIIISAICVSWWLMTSTFSYNPQTNAMVLASKVWSDFGAHIPLIRSFSLGGNFPRLLQGQAPQYPLFPGEPIRYHFLFYAFVGLLEKLGVRIDWALNIPSIIGFAALLIGVYLLAKKLFGNWFVGSLAALFVLCNGSLSFVTFFHDHPLSLKALSDIVDLKSFVSFAPWKAGDISAFWSLNIFTNQRHLGAAFALFILFLLTLTHIERSSIKKQLLILIPWSIVLGLLPFFHQPTLLMVGIALAWYFLVFPTLRVSLFITGIITFALAVVQILFIPSANKSFGIHIGFLMEQPITILSFITYWWHNIGWNLILIPLGFFIAPTRAKKYLFPMVLFFVIGFVFQFSVEIAANHKFFNLFLILGGMCSAYVITRIINLVCTIKSLFIRIPLFIIPITIILFLTLSGVIDLFPIINDNVMDLPDINANKNAQWFVNNTAPDAVILNANYFLHPATLAGRSIFLGWPYFAWSAGYDTTKRLNVDVKTMYNPRSLDEFCTLVQANHISYATLVHPHIEDNEMNQTIFEANFPEVNT